MRRRLKERNEVEELGAYVGGLSRLVRSLKGRELVRRLFCFVFRGGYFIM